MIDRNCIVCEAAYKPRKDSQRFCSRSCATKHRHASGVIDNSGEWSNERKQQYVETRKKNGTWSTGEQHHLWKGGENKQFVPNSQTARSSVTAGGKRPYRRILDLSLGHLASYASLVHPTPQQSLGGPNLRCHPWSKTHANHSLPLPPKSPGLGRPAPRSDANPHHHPRWHRTPHQQRLTK